MYEVKLKHSTSSLKIEAQAFTSRHSGVTFYADKMMTEPVHFMRADEVESITKPGTVEVVERPRQLTGIDVTNLGEAASLYKFAEKR
jgi:hypothetical protein